MSRKIDRTLPKFSISDNLAHDLRTIKIAKALGTGWYKGKFYKLMREIGSVISIGGEEYFTGLQLKYNANNFFNEGTIGYKQAELLRLMGLEDSDLNQIIQTSNTDHVDGVNVRWIAKEELTKERFSQYLQMIDEDLINVDTIEVDCEIQRYRLDTYPTSAVRPYNTRLSVYGDRLGNQQKFDGFDNLSWNGGAIQRSLPPIINRTASAIVGEAIRFKKAGVDVTSTLDLGLRQAVQAMLAYSGKDFMNLLSSTKIGERTYTVNEYAVLNVLSGSATYVSAIGTEVYSANILSAFIEDVNDFHWGRYTMECPQSFTQRGQWSSSCARGTIIPAVSISSTSNFVNTSYSLYSSAFWNYTRYTTRNLLSIISKRPIVQGKDNFLFYDTGKEDLGAYIKVSEFFKLTIEDLGYYLGNYFDIKIYQSSSGGGFFGGLINFLGGLFGLILNVTFNLIERVPILKLQLDILTWTINKIFNSDLDNRDTFNILAKILGVALTVLFGWVGAAISVGISVGIAKNDAEEEQRKNQEIADKKKEAREKELEQRKKEAEEKKKQQKIDTEGEENSREEFEAFLKNPLYKLNQEKNELRNSLNSQFKLL